MIDFSKRYRSHHDSTALLKEAFTRKPGPGNYVQGLLAGEAVKPRTIYVHIPYCVKNCSFCNLNRTLITEELQDYHRIIIEQIKKIARYRYIQSKGFESIYLGGGTPTTLAAEQLREVLEAIYTYLPIDPQAEISVESSLSELSEERLAVLQELGVNRLSIGVQTFVDRARNIMGRRGSGEWAAEKLQEVIALGFSNANIDLIYNYPEQTTAELSNDLELINRIDLAGLSFYSLILHRGSRLDQEIADGLRPRLAGIDREKAIFREIFQQLRAGGYGLLELTKLVKPGRDQYKYIQIKNRTGDCLALGLGAGGRLGNYLYYNGMQKELLLQPEPALSPMGREISEEYNIIDRINGELQFGRLDFDQIAVATGFDLKAAVPEWLVELAAMGLSKKSETELVLTDEGVFWGNNIGRELTLRLLDIFKKKKGVEGK